MRPDIGQALLGTRSIRRLSTMRNCQCNSGGVGGLNPIRPLFMRGKLFFHTSFSALGAGGVYLRVTARCRELPAQRV